MQKENKNMKPVTVTRCLLLLMVMICLAQESRSEGKEYGNPGFGKEIQNFESADRKQFPPPGAIVCIGSSSMRGWHSTIAEDLAPLTIIPRGFGGSTMNDALHYVDRIVIPYNPRAVVVYEGDNDIAGGIAPEKIRDTFSSFVEKVHKTLPETRIYFLSIKPSISRWKLWPQIEAANRLIEQYCSSDKRLAYVDMGSAMLDANGEPREDIFQEDKLHMTRAGYEIWRDALKPVLVKAELAFEPQKDRSAAEEQNNTKPNQADAGDSK